MKKYLPIIIALAIVILIASIAILQNDWSLEINDFESCIAAGNPAMESYPRQCRDPISDKTFTENLTIGGERDEQGCLGPAGYTWNETLQICLREWEVKGQDREILEYAMRYTTKEKGLTFTNISKEEGDDFFVVELETLGMKRTIDVFFSNLTKSLTPNECIGKGGRTQNIVAGDTCHKNETNIGEVVGFISPNICCIPNNYCSPESRGPNMYCIQVYEPVCGSDNKTYSNSCTVCLNSSVEYYINGECQ